MRILVFFAALVAASTQAEPYLAYEVGSTRFEYKTNYTDDIKESQVSNTFIAGYTFTQHMAVEASYFDTRDFESKVDVFNNSGDFLLVTQGEFRVKNKALSVLGNYSFNPRVSAFIKAGISRWDISANFEEYQATNSDDGIGYPVSLGAAFQYDSLATFYIAASYLRFDTGTDEDDKASLSTFSVGIKLTPQK